MDDGKARALDAYLVASARSGDRPAFRLLVRKWHGKFLAHAWRLLRDEEAAKDAVQGAWAEIVRSLPRLREDLAFAAWAYRIVSRRCARHVGGAVRDRRLAEDAAQSLELEQGAEGPPETAALHRAIAALPPDQRSAIALFYLEDMSVAEVAVALDVPAGTVKTRLMHARRKLRQALEGDE